MINILGFKRIFILLCLVALNVLLVIGVYLYMTPELKKKKLELRSLKSQTSSVRNDIGRMQVEFEQFKEQQTRFEIYKKDGFFLQQNRREVERLLKEIQSKSRVSAATIAISPASIEENKEAEKAEHKLLKSAIQISIKALDDTDIYHYLYLIEKAFPGHITIESINFEREGEISGTVLRAIAGGQNVPLVGADIKLVWRTMIPEAQLITEGGR